MVTNSISTTAAPSVECNLIVDVGDGKTDRQTDGHRYR